MANIKGSSAAIYSPVGNEKLKNSDFNNYDSWNGESFYIENNNLYIRDNGYVTQKIKGANQNEIWTLSGRGKDNLKISVYFLDYDDNAIYRSSEQFNSTEYTYISTYGVAPKQSNVVFIKLEGEGEIREINLQHLKPLAILSDWDGRLEKTEKKGFDRTQNTQFSGEAKEARYLDSVNTDTFQSKQKIFIGFLSSKSLFNRIEGIISSLDNITGNRKSKIKFTCEKVKIPFKEW